MKKRKIISGVLAISCLLGASEGSVFASELNGDGATGSTTLRKEIPASYTVIIPDTVDIPDFGVNTGSEIKLELKRDSQIEQNKMVSVILDSFDGSTEDNAKDNSAVKVGDKYYSPIRLTDAENGGNISGNQKSNGIISIGDRVASFDSSSKNLVKEKLYAYKLHTFNNSGGFVGTENSPAGKYEGRINFKLKYEDNTSANTPPDNSSKSGNSSSSSESGSKQKPVNRKKSSNNDKGRKDFNQYTNGH